MLRTNSARARANIHSYIMGNFDGCSYEIENPDNFHDTAVIIYEIFKCEKYSSKEEYRYYNYNECAAFTDWCAGLPSILDTCYYYNRSAVDDLGAILEETEEEKALFDESKAQELLTALIYREIKKEVNKGSEKKAG